MNAMFQTLESRQMFSASPAFDAAPANQTSNDPAPAVVYSVQITSKPRLQLDKINIIGPE